MREWTCLTQRERVVTSESTVLETKEMSETTGTETVDMAETSGTEKLYMRINRD